MKVNKSMPKISGLVVAALRNFRNRRGSNARDIMKYIMAEYDASEATVGRQLKVALKRGIEYGILKKTKVGYALNTGADIIGPKSDWEPMDACKKRRKRRCKPKRKRSSCGRKRASCKPRRRRRKSACGTCSSRGHKCPDGPIELIRGDSPSMEDAPAERSHEDDSLQQQPKRRLSRSKSVNRSRSSRSRSRSVNRYSASDNDEDHADDDL